MTILTPVEVAKRWRCKPEKIRKLLDSRKLAGFNVASPGCRQPRWRITEAAVLAYEAGQTATEPPLPPPRVQFDAASSRERLGGRFNGG